MIGKKCDARNESYSLYVKWFLLYNEYERFITGVCSNDVLEQEELFAIKGDITEEAALSDGTNLARSAIYDVDAALTYANQWCGIPVSDRNYVNGSTTNDSKCKFIFFRTPDDMYRI